MIAPYTSRPNTGSILSLLLQVIGSQNGPTLPLRRTDERHLRPAVSTAGKPNPSAIWE
jgi:hypothetical protein